MYFCVVVLFVRFIRCDWSGSSQQLHMLLQMITISPDRNHALIMDQSLLIPAPPGPFSFFYA